MHPDHTAVRRPAGINRLLSNLLQRNAADPAPAERFLFEQLEPRVLLSADLSIASATLAASNLASGAATSATIQLVKQGTDPVSETVRVKVYASLDAALDNADRLLGQVDVPASQLNGSIAPLQLALDTGAIAQPGNYQLYSVVDSEQAVTESDESNNSFHFPQALQLSGTFGQTADAVIPSLTLTDADGTRFTFTLSGNGTATLGYSAAGYTLQISGSDSATQLTLTASGGDGRVALGDITVAGSIKAIMAAAGDLHGNLSVGGSIRTLSLGDASGANISSSGSGTLDLTGRVFSATVLNTTQLLGSVTLQAWNAPTPGSSRLQAASLTTLNVVQNMAADLLLTGTGAGPLVLGTASIGGTVGNSQWNVAGRTGNLNLGNTGSGWHANVRGAMSQLLVKGDLSGLLAVASLQLLQVNGAAHDLTLLAGADLGSDAALGGSGSAADSFTAGTLGRLRILGAVTHSVFAAGVNPQDGIYGNADDTMPGTSANKVQELYIGGTLDEASMVIAPAFPDTVTAGGKVVAASSLPQLRTGAPTGVTPVLQAKLANDTGASASDRITNDASISGTAVGATILMASLDSSATPSVNLSASLRADGSFVLSADQLDQLAGGKLADGSHVLRLQATGAGGLHSQLVAIDFTLMRNKPTITGFGVASADALNGNPGQTTAARVQLSGVATPGATLLLGGQNIGGLVGTSGVFTLANVALTMGENTLTLNATDLAGNTTSLTRTITRSGQITQDAVLTWDNIALRAIQLDVTDPPIATRTLAIQSLAMYDTLAAIEGSPAYMVQRSVSGPVSAQLAVAVAAHRVLSLSYPAQRAVFDAALAQALAATTDGAAKDNAIALGLSIANDIWTIRSTDGYKDYVDYAGDDQPGVWRPTGPAYKVADEPQWATLTPFAISSPSAFRPVAPPALDSAAYASAVEEIKTLGSATSSARSADQTQIALFWADGMGSYTPPGHWNQIAAQVASAQGNSMSANARLFAELNVALADAGIAAWDAKYTYNFWRPETAVHEADKDNNPGTTADADWRPLLLTPSHPDYVSGHSTFSAAAATVLASIFGDNTAFSTTSTTLPGVVRNFTSFSQASEEAGRSRIYAGIHYQFSNEAGRTLGLQIGNAVLARFAQGADHQAPQAVLADTPPAVRTNLTLTGQLLDNLSGVASAQYRVDNGALQTLVLDSSQHFSITTALALDGSADGSHSITILARDAAGNLSAGITRNFVLDTQAPVLALTGLADGSSLPANARLNGSVATGGSALVSLSYGFDNGPLHSINPDASGAFDQALVLSGLDTGSHTLTILALDAAGNSSSLTRTLTLDNLIAFKVSKVTPLDGSATIGTTYRPQVFFSRAVNPDTLTANSFYATGPNGQKLATTIVPAQDGSFAWLYFDNPMPGSSNITLHLKGSAIRAAQDGVFLDADGDGSAGGELSWSFSTVSTASVANTKLVGKVVDPGPDLQPMSFDDIRRGPDGIIHTPDDVFLLPIANVHVYIIGRPDLSTYTDANGNFSFDEVPAGDVKVAIDGRTASNPPAGIFFPEMVMDVELRPGQTNTLMGTMGTPEEQTANADRREVYLPRVQSAAMQNVSNNSPTTITVEETAAPALTDAQRALLTLTVQPGSAVGNDGKVLDNVKIGISTVPPELVRDMLPPGVLQHTFDITIQAPGVDTFNAPLKITFPNVFNAAPGSQLNILSFDHTTGKLVISGTGTVSADGKSVVSDPGSGVMAPGWHGLVPPGVQVIYDIVDVLQKYREPLVDLAFDAFDVFGDIERLSLPIIAGVEGAMAGAVLGPAGAVAGFSLGFVLVETATNQQKKVLVDGTKDAIKAMAKGALRGDSPQQIGDAVKESIGESLDNFNNDKIKDLLFGKANPYISYATAWADAIDHSRSLAEDLGELLQPLGPDPDFSAHYQALANAFGWAPLTQEQMDHANLLMGTLPTALGTLPPPVARLFKVTAAYAQLSTTLAKPALNQSDLDLLSQSLATLDADPGIILNYQQAMTDYAHGLNNTIQQIIAVRQTPAKPRPPASAYYAFSVAGQEIRGVSTDGKFTAVLAPNSLATLKVFDPATGYIGMTSFKTGDSGSSVPPAPLVMGPASLQDSDGDGLPDLAEDIVGTRANARDSNGDGIDDLTSLGLGINPTGDSIFPSGVLGATTLRGNADSVAVAPAAANPAGLTAYVATGNYGLAVVDVSRFNTPTVRAELDLPGDNTDVAIDSARSLALVAAGSAGLHIVDVSQASAPVLRQTVVFPQAVNAVAARDGLAYVADGSSLAIVSVSTGEVLQTLDLGNTGGTTIQSLAIEGNTLYSVDSSHLLRSFHIDGSLLTARGTLTLPSSGRLFVGGGVAYIGAASGAIGGFITADVRDPAAMSLLSGVDNTSVGGTAVVANGSGLAITVGSVPGPQGQAQYMVDVLNVADPSNTGKFITRYSLPQVPADLALANGLAFIADGSGGLQVVNYAGFDTKGVAPTVSISVDASDADSNTPGLQLLEGHTVSIKTTVSDDVQVRNVELLVNGKVVSNDAAFPFDLTALVPAISAGSSVTLQVRATDTGGNSSLSNLLTLPVVADTFAPQLQSVSIDEGARRFFVRSIDLQFDEPLDPAKLNASGASIVRAGADGVFGSSDDVTIPVHLDRRNFGQVLSVIADSFLTPGDYRFTLSPSIVADSAGNALTSPIVRNFTIRPASEIRSQSGVAAIPTAPSANPGQQIAIAVPFDPANAKLDLKVIDANGTLAQTTLSPVRWDSATSQAWFNVPYTAVTGDAVVYAQVGNVRTDFTDGVFPLQIVPVVNSIDVQSVAADGSSAVVVLRGYGFVEGNGSEYRFGSSASIVDGGPSVGPDVQQIYDPTLGQYLNGQVTLTVPLSDGVFGAISVKTGGGTSAALTTNLGSVQSVALSGTPANAALASANPSQAITLKGSGLSVNSDILLRYTDYQGKLAMLRLSPQAASADGTTATLLLPVEANGVFALQMFGSSSAPLLQIVPTLSSFDEANYVYGSGMVEGATTYNFPGASIADTASEQGVDVSYYYDSALGNYIFGGLANLNGALPHHGSGDFSITTAGGTSAALALSSVRPGGSSALGSLADLAIDPTSGALWTLDTNNPGNLVRVDRANGAILQTIALSAALGNQYTANYAGLQVVPQAFNLAGTSVPAGSLLLTEGYPYNGPNVIVALNPATGAQLARLTLPTNYYATAGLYDASSGHLFLLSESLNKMVEINPATGAEITRFNLPISVQSMAGMALDPSDGNFWIGSNNSGSQIVKIDHQGVELRRIDMATQGLPSGQISGLAFDTDGSLRVATSQGVILRALLNTDVDVPAPTLSAISASALLGTAAQANVAAANVGQVIELSGSNFGTGTQVLFQVRDAAGTTSVVSVRPQLINAAGTRLQVVVPDLATTGNVQVSNVPTRNLGYSSGYTDAVYRRQTVQFTAGSANATIRFADGGLEAFPNETWGLDNVVVRQGQNIVFQDSFEGGAKANWSSNTTSSDLPLLTQYSGRFDNASQTLNLSGLTAGQSYTLSFDFYAFDSWDGSGSAGGPDQISVSVDGNTLYTRTVSNFVNSPQTMNATPGIRLQVVPTLTSISGNPGSDSTFTLYGSGFMEGASTVSVGGVSFADNDSYNNPFDIYGSRNDTMNVVAPRTLDGPIRISTAGGYAELARAALPLIQQSQFNSISATALDGVPANAAQASANTGQSITLNGQGFSASTLVQFQARDDNGQLGTITRTGSVGNGGKTLTVQVPALAVSGAVTILGSGASYELQVVPTLRGAGGSLTTGGTLLLDVTGLSAADLAIQIDGKGVGSFDLRTLIEADNSSNYGQQLLRLTVPAGVTAGIITVSTGGGSAVLRTGAVSIAAQPDLTPANDAGAILANALTVNLGINQSVKLGNVGLSDASDIDLMRIDLAAGDQLSAFLTQQSNMQLRIFDAAGHALTNAYRQSGDTTPLLWTAATAGSYYVGVSGYYNTAYDPTVAGSGSNGGYSGPYALSLQRMAAGASHLSGVTTTAASGTAAQSGVASANVGQTITLNGSALQNNEQVVFSVIDDSGRLSYASVAATTVAADGSSLTVVVPQNATTGAVRLARDNVGTLLQIVPTLSGVVASNGGTYNGSPLTLTGSGFSEGNVSVLFGNQQLNDFGRSNGIDVYNNDSRMQLTVPTDAPSGPIRVSTVGGTSSASGPSLSSIAAVASSGVPADASVASVLPGQLLTINGSSLNNQTDVVFETIDASGNRSQLIVHPSQAKADGTQAQVQVPLNAVSGKLRVAGDLNGAEFALQVIPVISSIDVQSVAADGSSAVVVLRGYGFVESNNSRYQFGSGAGAASVIDSGIAVGPDVQQIYDPARGQYLNGQVTLTVPLSDGAFGPVSVSTAGGTSANFNSGITSIKATAASGTPANVAQASANVGQDITIQGTGLTTGSALLLRYTDFNGAPGMKLLRPSSALADGTAATVRVPTEANGAFALQMLGATAQPLLQIVPTLKAWTADGTLTGSGLVEGATSYNFPGNSVVDTSISDGVDVSYYYNSALGDYVWSGQARLPSTVLGQYGLGTVSVQTAGGSATLALTMLRPGSGGTSVGGMGDVAYDPASGTLWTTDSNNPANLLRIDQANGAVLQTIALSTLSGTQYLGNYAGLQVLTQTVNLGGTSVPAGSLLLFKGYPQNGNSSVVAINPANGAALASLQMQGNYYSTAGLYDDSSKHLFLLSETYNQMVEVNATTGSEIGRYSLPVNIQGTAGIAIDPADGNFWLSGSNAGSQLVKVDRQGVELRRVDLAGQGIPNGQVSGISFAADGTLRISSNQGVIYQAKIS